MRAMEDRTDDPVPVFVDLPTGRAGMVEYATPYAGGGELARTVSFLLHDGRGCSVTCMDATSHADRWLSIAESIEFRTAEEYWQVELEPLRMAGAVGSSPPWCSDARGPSGP